MGFSAILLLSFACLSVSVKSERDCAFQSVPNYLVNLYDIIGDWVVVSHSSSTGERLVGIKKYPSDAGQFVAITFHSEDATTVVLLKLAENKVLEAAKRGPTLDALTPYETTKFSAKLIHLHVGSGSSRHQEKILTFYTCLQEGSNLQGVCDPAKTVVVVLANNFNPSSHGLKKSYESLRKVCQSPINMHTLLEAGSCESALHKTEIFHHHHDKHLGHNHTATEEHSHTDVHHSHDVSHFQKPHKSHNHKFCPVDKIKYISINDISWENATGYFYLVANLDKATKWTPTYLRGHMTQLISENKWEIEYAEVDGNGNCNTIKTQEWADPTDPILIQYKLLSTSDPHPAPAHWQKGSTRFVYYNRTLDLSITYHCHKLYEGGACEKYEVEVYHGHPHITSAHVHEINHQMKKLCIDPAELHYTVAEVDCPPKEPAAWKHHGHDTKEDLEGECKFSAFKAVDNINLRLMNGVWHTIMHSNPDAYPFDNVVSKRKVSLAKIFPPRVESTFYGLLKNGTCEGPMTAQWILNPSEPGTITLQTTAMGREISMKLKVLHSDPKFLIFIWCENSAEDCQHPHFRIDSTMRTVKTSDLNRLRKEHRKLSCPEAGRIAHMTTLTHCGDDIDDTRKHQRGYLGLKAKETLTILKDHHDRQCKLDQIKGRYVDPEDMVGVWYTIGHNYPGGERIVASVWTNKRISVNQLVGHEAILEKQDGKQVCTKMRSHWTLSNSSSDDYFYDIHFNFNNRSVDVQSRLIWFSKKYLITYNCLEAAADGTCAPGKAGVWIASRSQIVDPEEFSLLRKVVDSVCVDSSKIRQTNTHDKCIREHIDPDAIQPGNNCKYGEIVGIPTGEEDHSSVGSWQVLARYPTFTDPGEESIDYRRFVMFAEENGVVKAENYFMRNGQCTGPQPETFRRIPNSPTHAWTAGSPNLPETWWDLHVCPQYRLSYACYGDLANCANSSMIVLLGKHKKKDQTALAPIKKLIATKLCVNPKKLTWLNVAGNCGVNHGDVTSCKLVDIMKNTDHTHNPDEIVGKWYLHGALHKHTLLVSLDISATAGQTHKFDAVLHLKQENCSNGPEVHGKLSHLHGCHYVMKNSIAGLNTTHTHHFHMAYLSNTTAIDYNCNGVGNDGTCPIENTEIAIWSRNIAMDSTEYDSLVAKLKPFCVDKTDLHKLKPNRCVKSKVVRPGSVPLYEISD